MTTPRPFFRSECPINLLIVDETRSALPVSLLPAPVAFARHGWQIAEPMSLPLVTSAFPPELPFSPLLLFSRKPLY